MNKRAFTPSSGNVYRDLGHPNAEEMALKADLLLAITKAVEGRRFRTQASIGNALGIDQPKVSKLLRGQFREYSVERLMGFLVLLGHDVEIKVRRRPKLKPGHIHVNAMVR